MSRVNVNDFHDGQELFIYFNRQILDGSGRCELQITDNPNRAAESYKGKVFKVQLQEVPVKMVTHESVVVNTYPVLDLIQ